MLQKICAVFTAILTLITSLSQLIFTPNVLRIDFDRTVGAIKPVHNVGRMPEYEVNSEINRYFTEANMTSCRTHDVNETDIHRIFPDFSRDVNDESAYNFAACDKVLAAVADKCMTVNENCEWVEIALPDVIESGSMLYITFVKK